MRRERLDLPGFPLHITHRGVDRCTVFRGALDRHAYLIAAAGAAERWDVRIHAYVLMGNHVHLLVSGGVAGAIGKFMQSAAGRYTRQANRRWGRTGTLWEGRFRSSVVDSDAYLLNCMSYIEQNPVRAGLCSRAWDWPWSSASHHLGLRCDPWIRDHEIFLSLESDTHQRRVRWRVILEDENPDAERLREAVKMQGLVGSPAFAAEVARLTGRQVEPRPIGRPRTRD